MNGRAAEQSSDTIRSGFHHCLGRCGASRLSRDRALLALRLAEPRQTGFVPGGLRSLARTRSVPLGTRLSADLLPGDPDRRERQHPRAADRECPINTDVPSPVSGPARPRCASSKPPAELRIDARANTSSRLTSRAAQTHLFPLQTCPLARTDRLTLLLLRLHSGELTWASSGLRRPATDRRQVAPAYPRSQVPSPPPGRLACPTRF